MTTQGTSTLLELLKGYWIVQAFAVAEAPVLAGDGALRCPDADHPDSPTPR